MARLSSKKASKKEAGCRKKAVKKEIALRKEMAIKKEEVASVFNAETSCELSTDYKIPLKKLQQYLSSGGKKIITLLYEIRNILMRTFPI